MLRLFERENKGARIARIARPPLLSGCSVVTPRSVASFMFGRCFVYVRSKKVGSRQVWPASDSATGEGGSTESAVNSAERHAARRPDLALPS